MMHTEKKIPLNYVQNCVGAFSQVEKRTLPTIENLIILQEMYTLNLIEWTNITYIE